MADLRQTGKYGVVYLPNGAGISVSNQALTPVASKEIGGTTYTDRFVYKSGSMWNKGQALSVRVAGISGELSLLEPGTSADKISLKACAFFKDNSSTTATVVSAQADLALTRPTSGSSTVVNLIVVDVATKAASVVAGTQGTRVATINAAGGYPYVGVDKLVIGAVALDSTASATVLAEEIEYVYYGTSRLVQERCDLPGYDILPAEGGVLLQEALPKIHTGGLARVVYASFYDQSAVLMQAGDTSKWDISTDIGTVEMIAQNDLFGQKDTVGAPKWSGSISRFYVKDDLLFKLALEQKRAIVKLYPNKNESTKYYMGAVIIKSWKHSCAENAAQVNDISFEGDGNLIKVGF